MKRILSLVVAVCLLLGCCPAAWAASPATLSTQDKQELEAFLSRFEWYRDDYSRADPGAGTDWDHWTLLDCLVRNPLIVDYSKYPVAQPDTSWDLRRDPLGKWNTYWRFDEASVDWVLQYIFALSPSQIAGLKTQLEQHSAWVYRYRGSYYSMPGGIGGGNEATITQVERDSYYTRVTYRVAGSPVATGGSSFSDVPAGAYYGDAVRWAVANGITTGTGNGKFSPNSPCTRGQIAAFLHRAAQRVPSWYGTYVAESGETLTVTRVTGTQVLLTARLLDAAGGWYTAAHTLTFSNGAKTAATVPFRTGEALLVTYTLQGDRIIVDYPEGWRPDQEFLRQE